MDRAAGQLEGHFHQFHLGMGLRVAFLSGTARTRASADPEVRRHRQRTGNARGFGAGGHVHTGDGGTDHAFRG